MYTDKFLDKDDPEEMEMFQAWVETEYPNVGANPGAIENWT